MHNIFQPTITNRGKGEPRCFSYSTPSCVVHCFLIMVYDVRAKMQKTRLGTCTRRIRVQLQYKFYVLVLVLLNCQDS